MDMIFTFEDGSESLAHYGVMGMKWGKWNAETAARYSSGSGHRSITRANKKVDKRADELASAEKTYGKSSYQARAATKKFNDAVEKRQYRVEKNRPGESGMNPNRYNELRSNQRLKRAALTGIAAGAALGSLPFPTLTPFSLALAANGTMIGGTTMSVVSLLSSYAGKRAVTDVLRGKETYRVNAKTGRYENTTPYSTEANQRMNETPVYTKRSTYSR